MPNSNELPERSEAMTEEAFSVGGAPLTPCTLECNFDKDKGYCRSCLRTINDLKKWSTMTQQERNERMTELLQLKVLFNQ
jgi:predicted Fe-S protein YdhL (DUF1289 family)